MKALHGGVLCLLAIIASAGCRSPETGSGDSVQVIIEGSRAWPASLVGRWKADQHGWEIVFDSAGRITSAVLSLGRVEVTPGHRTTVPTRGGQGVFEPGPWTVHYVSATSQLTVKLVMDHIRVEMADNVLEGRSIDTFSGTVSESDGIWQTQWTAFTRYHVHAAQDGDVELSTDPMYGEARPLTFQKVPPQ
jgi:hypothetical protein